MEDSIEKLESICELLVEIAALQRLRSTWLPTSPEDRHEVERFMLLEKLITKKEQQRNQHFRILQDEYPDLDPLLEALTQKYDS